MIVSLVFLAGLKVYMKELIPVAIYCCICFR
jgi:hypothetical protein